MHPMNFECHGQYMMWRAAEGLPYPDSHGFSHRESRADSEEELEEDDDETHTLEGSA